MCSKNLFIPIMLLLASCQRAKTGYVDVYKLVEGFDMQKEFTTHAREELNLSYMRADSVISIERLRDTIKGNALKEQLYSVIANNIEVNNKEIEKIIWNRLNPYIISYGKKKNYKYIFGANGTGNILYADEQENITADLIIYVNKSYNGKN